MRTVSLGVRRTPSAGIRFLETNEDLEKLIDWLILQPETKGIVMAAAVCDWEAEAFAYWDDAVPDWNGPVGKKAPRLQTSRGNIKLSLAPADKLIGKIRKVRLHTHVNMVITPEEAKYHVGKDRKKAIKGLCEMIAMRSQLHFTRSTVIDGDTIPWNADAVPANLRKVVNHMIKRGAYKPFKGKTVGHFATRGPKDGIIYTSRRKTNFNNLPEDGLLRIDTVGDDQVIAHGAKPSVGGQSQRIVFEEHPDVDCIVHAHVPLRERTSGPRGSTGDWWVPDLPPPGGVVTYASTMDEDPSRDNRTFQIRSQRPYECGSHECGRSTSEGLQEMWPGIKAVMLDEHGPNICFSKDTDPDMVIEFIERYWDLEAKTGGPVSLEARA
jgi:hypothetical protein